MLKGVSKMKCPFMNEVNFGQMSQTHCITNPTEIVRQDCQKGDCGLWVVLNAGKVEQGRCALTWFPILLVELRVAIEQKTKQKVTDEG